MVYFLIFRFFILFLLFFLISFCNPRSKDSFKDSNFKKEYTRFFFTKRIVPSKNFRNIQIVFDDEIPVPYDINDQLKAIENSYKVAYKVFYDNDNFIKRYQYFKNGQFIYSVLFEYENLKYDLGKRLKLLKYYSDDFKLQTIESFLYNEFGLLEKTERFLMPGYDKINIY